MCTIQSLDFLLHFSKYDEPHNLEWDSTNNSIVPVETDIQTLLSGTSIGKLYNINKN